MKTLVRIVLLVIDRLKVPRQDILPSFQTSGKRDLSVGDGTVLGAGYMRFSPEVDLVSVVIVMKLRSKADK